MARSTPEERAKAAEWAERGFTLGMIAVRLDRSVQTVRKWLDPEVRERERQRSLSYRHANKERLNAHARQYMRRQRKGTCPVCRRPTPRAGVKRCSRCRAEDQSWLWAELETLWNDGLSIEEIARETRRTKQSVAGHIRRMRAAGRNVPARRGNAT